MGAGIDNRQGDAGWSPTASAVYFTVQERGNVHLLIRLPAVRRQGRKPIVTDRGSVGSVLGRPGRHHRLLASRRPTILPQLYLRKARAAAKKLTDLNADVLAGKQIAEVESFTFISNDNKYEVEAFLTKPLSMTAASKYPLIVNIHGGPHGQQGPAFNFQNQVYAARAGRR